MDEEPYKQLFHLFEKYEIGAVFYIGGNDSMDTIARLAAYGAKVKAAFALSVFQRQSIMI